MKVCIGPAERALVREALKHHNDWLRVAVDKATPESRTELREKLRRLEQIALGFEDGIQLVVEG